MSFDESFLDELAEALQRTRLDAVVVGNAASVIHGAPVMTRDVDLLVRDTRDNRKKVLKLAEILGGVVSDLSDLMECKSILGAAVPVDVLFNKMGGGIGFNRAKAHSTLVKVGSHSLRVASLEDVIASKRAAGRGKDRAILSTLENTLAIQKHRK